MKSRLVSKDVFVNLLNSCTSRKDKICLHQTCEFLFWFLRNNLSHHRTSLASEHMPEMQAKVSKNLLDPSKVLDMGEEPQNKWVEVIRKQCIA